MQYLFYIFHGWRPLTTSAQRGQSLIELLITIGISAIIIPALFGSVVASRAGSAQRSQRVQALALAKEGQEASRITRDNDWNSFAVNGTYHPVVSGSTWMLAANQESINGFTRSVVISDAYRDSNGILASSGTPDPSVKLVTVTVSWNTPIPASVVLTSYLARLKSLTYTQTTYKDFSAGTNNSTVVSYTNGSPTDGQVQLGPGGLGDWCNPNATPIITYNLTRQGVPTAISATYNNSQVYSYTTSGYNASGDSIDSQVVSDPPAPTPPTVSSGPYYNQWKTYGIYATPNYVFTTTNHPSVTLDVENVSGATFTQAATYNAGGAGISVTVPGSTGFVTVGNTLYAFNASTISGSLSTIGSIGLAGTGNKVVVVGDYAYVAISYNASGSPKGELQIINVSNPAAMSVVSTTSIGNGQDGVDVYVDQNGQYAYLVTTYASGQNDFYILDVTTKTAPVTHGSYSTNGMNPLGVTGIEGDRAIIVGQGGQPYQVLNTFNVNNPYNCLPPGFALPGVTTVRAVAAVSEPDHESYSYILTDNSSAEFQIVEGGSGGAYTTMGTFTSSIFAVANPAAFNRFDTTTTLPSGTDITYQVAIANKVNGTCDAASMVYVGPNGTASPSDVFPSAGGTLPLVSNSGTGYANPGECLAYKAYLTSTNAQTPILQDITFSYSP